MLAAAIAVTSIAAVSLIAYATYWLVTDARERKWQADRADAWVRAHKEAISAERYRYDDEGRPL